MGKQVPSLTCPVGEEPECKDITGRVQHIKVGDCTSEGEVDIHYCQVRSPWFRGGVSSFEHLSLDTLCKDLGSSQGGDVKETRNFLFPFFLKANILLK